MRFVFKDLIIGNFSRIMEIFCEVAVIRIFSCHFDFVRLVLWAGILSMSLRNFLSDQALCVQLQLQGLAQTDMDDA